MLFVIATAGAIQELQERYDIEDQVRFNKQQILEKQRALLKIGKEDNVKTGSLHSNVSLAAGNDEPTKCLSETNLNVDTSDSDIAVKYKETEEGSIKVHDRDNAKLETKKESGEDTGLNNEPDLTGSQKDEYKNDTQTDSDNEKVIVRDSDEKLPLI